MRKKKMTKYQSLPALSLRIFLTMASGQDQTKPVCTYHSLYKCVRFNCSWMLDEFQKISSEFSEYIWINEPETLIYSGGVTTTDTVVQAWSTT